MNEPSLHPPLLPVSGSTGEEENINIAVRTPESLVSINMEF